MRRWRLALSTAVVASLWVAALVGPTGYTLGAFTGSTSAANTQFKTANSFGIAPVASPITPYSSASSVALNTKITISFSEAMDQATSDAAFSLAPLSGADSACQGGTAGSAVAGSFSWENNATMLVFSPSANLTASSCYQASIGTGATSSTTELHLASSASSAFQTGTSTANTNPIIVPPTSPTGGSTGVSTNNPIQLTFSEAMNTSTTQAAFSLASCGATTTCPGTGNANVVCWVMPVSSAPQCPSGSDTTTQAGGAFSWSGAGQNILTFTPNGLAASTYYAITLATSATDLYGNALSSNAYSAFQFATAAGPDNTAPAAPTVLTPSVAVWTNNATYTLTGQVEANALVRIYSGASLVASIQLNGGVTNFSLLVPLQVGTNSFTVTATDAAGNVSPSTAVSTITRSDPQTNPSTLQLSPGSTSVTLVAPYTGDADSNATATVSWVSGKCSAFPCSGLSSPTSIGGGANGQFSTTISALTNNAWYSFVLEITDPDGFASTGACNYGTSGSPITVCGLEGQVATVKTTASNPGQVIQSVLLTPTDGVIASLAPQEQGITVGYSCASTLSTDPCFGASTVSIRTYINTSTKKSQGADASTGCTKNLPLVDTSPGFSMLWDGKTKLGVYALDDTYGFDVQIFAGNGCSGAAVDLAGASTASPAVSTITVDNSQSLALTPPPSTVSLGTGQSAHITASLTSYLGNPIADGSTSLAGTGAVVSFSAVGSVCNTQPSCFSLTRASSNVGEVYSGDAGGGCNPTAGAGQACDTLTVNSATAQTITINATVLSQTSAGTATSYTAQTTILDPPLPPGGLALSPGSIRLAWQPSSTLNVAGYRIYLGHQPGQYSQVIDAGNVTSYHDTNVTYGTTYYVTVRSYTNDGLLSAPAPEESITLPPLELTPTATTVACTSVSATPGVTGTAVASTATASAPLPAFACTPTPSSTPAPTLTSSPTPTPAGTCSALATATPTATPATLTPTATATASDPASATSTSTSTPIISPTACATPSQTPSPTITSSPTATSSATPTPTLTATATFRPTSMASATPHATATTVPAATSTPNAGATSTATAAPTVSPTSTAAPPATATPTPSPTTPATQTPTGTPAPPPATATPTP